MSNSERAYDSWKTREVESVEERREIGKLCNIGSIATNCGRTITVYLEFFYLQTGSKMTFHDTSITKFFVNDKQVEMSHPLLERYEDEIEDLKEKLIEERIAEEA